MLWGDWLTLLLAALAVGALYPLLWTGGQAEKAVVRVNGKVVSEVDLAVRKQISVKGPLGTSVIAIEPGRARVLSDPGPRQYCVQQGWLSRAGDVAICAPSQLSLQVVGKTSAYDSLAY